MTITDLLSRLDGVRAGGHRRYVARCPAHPDRNPSLSIREGERGILLRCWAGCALSAITDKIRLTVSDLFYGHLSDPWERRQTILRRAKEQAVQRVACLARGRQADARRQAEYLIQSARAIRIENWTNKELDKRLNALADAYEILERERHDA
jgi:hypothetical protein